MERIYLGYDNTIDLILKNDGAAQDLSAINKVQLIIGTTTLDSNTHPEYFDWTAGDGELDIAAGDATLTAGSYNAKLIIFDAGNPDGIVWGEIEIVVE